MRDIVNLINKLKVLTERLFPERQLYFRTNGIVRFISISRRSQLLITSVLSGVVIWSAVTTYSFIFRAEILAAKDMELVQTEEKYHAANQQFDQLKNDIAKSTKALEQRQIYLQQLLDADKSLSAPVEDNVMDTTGGDGDETREPLKAPFPVSDKHADSPADKIFAEHHNQLNNLAFSLSRIEQQQQALAERMIARLSNKIEYVESTLQKSGIKAHKLMQLAENRPSLSMAMGGPFILYAENSDTDLSTNEPFAKLYTYHNRLIDLENSVQHIPVGKPAKKYYISSGFGIRKDPFRKKWARHHGIDMAGWWKTPIYASADGTVIKAGRNGAYGNFIEIDHGNGFRSRYGHLSKIKVKKGDRVTLEQEIGLMGSTGRSTSPHLHYEIWFNGKPINPFNIFKAADNVLKIQRQEYDS